MSAERITLEELSKISDKAEKINVSDHVRFLAEDAANSFCRSCKYAAQKGERFYSEYAQRDSHRYIFVDKDAIRGGKNVYVDDLFTGWDHEENVCIIDDFIYAIGVFIKQVGILKFDIKKVPVESPPTVRVTTYSCFGLFHHVESVPVPSWYVVISTEW